MRHYIIIEQTVFNQECIKIFVSELNQYPNIVINYSRSLFDYSIDLKIFFTIDQWNDLRIYIKDEFLNAFNTFYYNDKKKEKQRTSDPTGIKEANLLLNEIKKPFIHEY